MKTAKVGDIVVVVKMCRGGCGACERELGRSAVVARVYLYDHTVDLHFNNSRRKGSFFRFCNLYNTGLFV